MKKVELNKRALKISFWGSLGRLIGVVMAAGAGSLLYQLIGSNTNLAIGVALGLVIIGFGLMWFSEYERETNR